MAATATFHLTFPEECWSNIIVTTKGFQALCSDASFSWRNAIHQTEFNSFFDAQNAIS